MEAPGIEDRSPLHVLDPLGARRQHDEAVEAERRPAGVRHLAQRVEEILVDRMRLP